MPKLTFISGAYAGRSMSLLPGKPIVIGRDGQADVSLPDETLSRQHCRISSIQDKVVIDDLGSTNGTFINGVRLQGCIELFEFDRITLGDTEIELQPARSELRDIPLSSLATPKDSSGNLRSII